MSKQPNKQESKPDRSTPWRNRIVGHVDINPHEINFNENNWRLHPEAQHSGMERVLDDVGFVQSVIVNQRTNRLVDGHLRVELARDRNEPTIPVVLVDLSEEEEKLILATIDPLAAMAQENTDQLNALQAELSDFDFSLLEESSVDPMTIDLGDGSIDQEDPMDKITIMVPHESVKQATKAVKSAVEPFEGYVLG